MTLLTVTCLRCPSYALQVATDRKLAKDVLPYAVALAAATSAETPFVSLDSIQVRPAAIFSQCWSAH